MSESNDWWLAGVAIVVFLYIFDYVDFAWAEFIFNRIAKSFS